MRFASYVPMYAMPVQRNAASMIWTIAGTALRLAIAVLKNVQVWRLHKR